MEKYVLDTNLFFNMEEGIGLGSRTEEVTRKITDAAKEGKRSKTAEFLIPPRVVDEYLSFFDDPEQPFIKEFLASMVIKSPEPAKTTIGAEIIYRMVDDVRDRSYRGLRIGEEEIVRAARVMAGKGVLGKKDFEIQSGTVVRSFRERYRQATRFGFLDSLADLDIILLAKENDAILVTTDEGVRRWGRMFGVRELPASSFGARVLRLLSLPHRE